jgi:glycosyltransferase involved in cell wall biosynthesis
MRLHRGLLELGIDSHLLAADVLGSIDARNVHRSRHMGQRRRKLRKDIERAPMLLYPHRRRRRGFSHALIGNSGVLEEINEFEADIVHLHWVNAGFLSITDIGRIRAPKIWSLCDMWPFTGGCHYAGTCSRYEQGCGKCPQLGSSYLFDLSRIVFGAKKRSFDSTPIAIVAKSRWIKKEVMRASLFDRSSVYHLPNGIDTRIFRRTDKGGARKKLGIPDDIQLVAFGAMASDSDPRKGYSLLRQAMRLLSSTNVGFLVFGNERKNQESEVPRLWRMGHVTHDSTLVSAYNAADVLVFPSLEENLSNVILEAMACGLPCVGFDVGGNSDMIVHKKNGYLCCNSDGKSLADGILWTLENRERLLLGENSIDHVCKEFEIGKVAPQYEKFYVDFLTDLS